MDNSARQRTITEVNGVKQQKMLADQTPNSEHPCHDFLSTTVGRRSLTSIMTVKQNGSSSTTPEEYQAQITPERRERKPLGKLRPTMIVAGEYYATRLGRKAYKVACCPTTC
jgi:hypothetical protein